MNKYINALLDQVIQLWHSSTVWLIFSHPPTPWVAINSKFLKILGVSLRYCPFCHSILMTFTINLIPLRTAVVLYCNTTTAASTTLLRDCFWESVLLSLGSAFSYQCPPFVLVQHRVSHICCCPSRLTPSPWKSTALHSPCTVKASHSLLSRGSPRVLHMNTVFCSVILALRTPGFA